MGRNSARPCKRPRIIDSIMNGNLAKVGTT
jgi:hypothetical protein